MKHPAEALRERLDRIADALSKGALLSIPPEEQESLGAEVEGLYEKLRDIGGQFLTAGLLGGTGVGKSTLMNALAGSEIASTSHRRPHTDRILIYRYHEAPPPPPLPLADVPWQEVLHGGEAIRHILLCDLPDFDSLVAAHAEQVLHFLEHLDILIWVTSPEKYADARFYEFLNRVPKASQNFLFVLNKADILFDGRSREEAYDQLETVVRGFRDHIKNSGITDPLLYPLSAQAALSHADTAPWDQFPAFRQQVFRQRDFKQITAIKAANLGVAVQGLAKGLRREIEHLELYIRVIDQSAEALEQGRLIWRRSGGGMIDLWMDRQIPPEAFASIPDARALVGPGHGLGALILAFQARQGMNEDGSVDVSQYAPPDEIAVTLKRRLEWVEDQVTSSVLRAQLPGAFLDRLKESLEVEARYRELGDRFFTVVSSAAAGSRGPSHLGFRTVQWIAYLLLLVLLLFAVGDEATWRQVLAGPDAQSISRLLLSMVHILFSGKGLAALGTYALLNLFLAFRFYGWYKRRLRRKGRKVITFLKAELKKVWEGQLDTLIGRLSGVSDDARDRIATLRSIQDR